MTNLYKYIAIISVYCIPVFAAAQEVLLEKDLPKSIYNKKTGINHRQFGSVFADFGVYPYQEDLKILPLRSHNFNIGYRWNHRIYGIYSAGFSVSYFYDVFLLKQENGKKFPSSDIHLKEKLQKHDVALDIYNRFTFKKEYNHLGYYIDAGMYLSQTLASRYKVVDKYDNPALPGEKKITVIRNLKILETLNPGLFLRIGHNEFYAVFRYRLGNWITQTYSEGQPPQGSAGFGVNF